MRERYLEETIAKLKSQTIEYREVPKEDAKPEIQAGYNEDAVIETKDSNLDYNVNDLDAMIDDELYDFDWN